MLCLRYDSVNTQRQRDKQRLTDLERNLTDERQQKQRLESQIRTEKSVTKKLQDDLSRLSLTPAKSVCLCSPTSSFFHSSRSECTDQCLKRKRDLENETRDIRRLINDKDERIKILENEVKVRLFPLSIDPSRTFVLGTEISRIESGHGSSLSTSQSTPRTQCSVARKSQC